MNIHEYQYALAISNPGLDENQQAYHDNFAKCIGQGAAIRARMPELCKGCANYSERPVRMIGEKVTSNAFYFERGGGWGPDWPMCFKHDFKLQEDGTCPDYITPARANEKASAEERGAPPWKQVGGVPVVRKKWWQFWR